MKAFTKPSLTALALFLTAGSAWAYPVAVGDTVRMYNNDTAVQYEGHYQADNISDKAGTFGVFCVELNEYFTPGKNYSVASISNGASKGGLYGQTGTNFDPISKGTQWLYHHFLLKDIQSVTGVVEKDYQLQLAFWYLENELDNRVSQNATYFDAYHGATGITTDAEKYVAAAQLAIDRGAFLGDVKVMNLIDASGNYAQSQLIGQPVPEPSTMLLVGAGLIGLGFARRKAQNKTA